MVAVGDTELPGVVQSATCHFREYTVTEAIELLSIGLYDNGTRVQIRHCEVRNRDRFEFTVKLDKSSRKVTSELVNRSVPDDEMRIIKGNPDTISDPEDVFEFLEIAINRYSYVYR